MADFNSRLNPLVLRGIPTGSMTDLYRVKYGFPIDGESHERFIATKAPVRKNRDYRPRFKNYSFGFPTYKRDNYTRHWYNLIDVFRSDHAPLIKYTKIYIISFVSGLCIFSAKGFGIQEGGRVSDQLNAHKMNTSSNYLKKVALFSELKAFYNGSKTSAATFGIFAVSFAFLVNKFKDWGYSFSQSILRATAILSPIAIFLKFDRPVVNFWYHSMGLTFVSYFALYVILVSKHSFVSGQVSPISEKFYLKNVTPEEIAKIEYDDIIQNYGRMFDQRNKYNYYNQAIIRSGEPASL